MPSIDCTDEIDIDAPAELVFRTVADYANWHDWMPMFQCELIDASEIAPGVRVRHRYGPPRLTLNSFVREVRKVTPYERIEESYVEGDLIGDGTWTFTAVPGGTRASYHCVVRSNTLMAHISLMLAGEKGHKGVYKTLLEKLKARCEAR